MEHADMEMDAGISISVRARMVTPQEGRAVREEKEMAIALRRLLSGTASQGP